MDEEIEPKKTTLSPSNRTYRIIILVLAVILAGYWAYNEYYQPKLQESYQKGLTDGQLLLTQSIWTTGNIPMITKNENNETVVQQIAIATICQGGTNG